MHNPRPRGRGLWPRLGERPAPSSPEGARCQSLRGDAVLSPLLGERQIRPSSAEIGEGSSAQPAPCHPQRPVRSHYSLLAAHSSPSAEGLPHNRPSGYAKVSERQVGERCPGPLVPARCVPKAERPPKSLPLQPGRPGRRESPVKRTRGHMRRPSGHIWGKSAGKVDTSGRRVDTFGRKLNTSRQKLNTSGQKLNTSGQKLNTWPKTR